MSGQSGLPPRSWGRRLVIGIPLLWLLIFFMVPFVMVLVMSLSESDGVTIKSLLTVDNGTWQWNVLLDNYVSVARDTLYLNTYLSSLKYAAATAIICLLIGYPFAYFMARADKAWQPLLVMLVMLPFWTSFLLRVYAWKGLLSEGGWVYEPLMRLGVDHLLSALGWISAPGQLLNSPFSLIVGMSYTYLPFMVLPLYATLSKMDLCLIEAATDLGATAWVAFWKITVPLSRGGVIAGTMLVFIPCVGEYVIPELLGGPETLMIGRVLWDEFFSNNDWPLASTLAVVMVVLVIVPLALFNKYQAQSTPNHS